MPYVYQFDRRERPPYRWIVLTDNCRVPIYLIVCGRAVVVERTAHFLEQELNSCLNVLTSRTSVVAVKSTASVFVCAPAPAVPFSLRVAVVAVRSFPPKFCSHAGIGCETARIFDRQSALASVRHGLRSLPTWFLMGQVFLVAAVTPQSGSW